MYPITSILVNSEDPLQSAKVQEEPALKRSSIKFPPQDTERQLPNNLDPTAKDLFLLEDTQQSHNLVYNITKTMRRICKEDILEKECITSGTESIEEYATAIIERALTLQQEKDKPVKKLALTDLLKTLQSMGLSYYSSVITKISYLYATSLTLLRLRRRISLYSPSMG